MLKKKKPIAQGLSINSYLITKQARASGTFENVTKMSKGKNEYKSSKKPWSYSQAEQKVHQIKTLRVFLNFSYSYPKTTRK